MAIGILSAAALYVLTRLALAARVGPRGLWLLAGLRAAIFTLVLLAIANPAWLRMVSQGYKPRLVVLRDASASMDLADAGGETRSRQVSRQLAAPATIQALAAFDVVSLPFTRGLGASDPQGSDLALALRQAAQLYSPQSLLLVSDGAETYGSGRLAAAGLRAQGLRVDTVGVGSSTPPPDVGPVTLSAPRLVKENQPFPVTVGVAANGVAGPQSVEVSRDGQVFARSQVALRHTQQQVHLQASGLSVGYHLLTVNAAPRPGEATLTNNQRTVLVEARRDKTRFVILAGAPSPEYANFKRVLAGLPKMDFDWHVRVGKSKFVHEVGDRPQGETLNLGQLLANRNVLVAMDLEASALDANTIRAFVGKGGSVAVLGGPRSLGAGGYGGAAWTGLLPARVAGNDYSSVPVATGAPNAQVPLGRDLAQAAPAAWWNGAPFLAGTNRLAATSGATVILRTRAGAPLVATQGLGQGRSLVVATDGTYRWVLSPQADEQSHKLHEVFWQTIIAWLAQPRDDRQVLLLLDPPIAAFGQPVRALVQVSHGPQPVNDAQVTITVQREGGSQSLPCRLTAVGGRYQTALGDLQPGTYTVRAEAVGLGSDERKLVVEPGGGELARMTLQAGTLQDMAQAGGGEYAPLDQMAQLLRRLPSARGGHPVRVPARPWRTWPLLVTVLTLCAAEWALRRRWGL